MSLLNLEFVESNDPAATFVLRYLLEDHSLEDAPLGGSDEVELFIKSDIETSDASALVKLTRLATGAAQRITVQDAPNAHKVNVQFLASDFAWTSAVSARVYHLDVIKSGRRQTFAHGTIAKVNV